MNASMLVLGALVLGVGSESSGHPWLFMTPDTVDRARTAMETDRVFTNLAEGIRERAENAAIGDLPELERAWWEEAREMPWAETYPIINHHTGKVPREWAQAANDCARAWLLFPDSGLDAKGREALLGLSGYTFEFEHFDVGLNYATWGRACLEAYDILYPGFTEAERDQMDAFFLRMVEAVRKNHEFWVEHEPGGPINNHYLWHALTGLMYGLFYDEPERVHEAIYGPKGMAYSLEHGFNDEGFWAEASLMYQSVATAPMVIMAELLENAEADERIWDMVTDDGRTLRQSYDALMTILFPDGTLPNIGDCYGRRPALGSIGDYERLYARFGDPAYAWILNQHGRRSEAALFHGVAALPERHPPAQRPRIWQEHGFAMLRTTPGQAYWTGAGWTLFATVSDVPCHAHYDGLSIQLYGDGRHWLVDADAQAGVYHAFSANIQRELNSMTVSHNTVLVDRQNQRFPDRQLDIVEFHVLPDVQRFTMGDLDGRLYPGVRQLRTLLVRDDYVLDVFQVEAEEAREFTWVVHVDGDAQTSSIGDWEATTFPEGPPWNWLREPERALESVDTYAEGFQAENARFHLDLVTDAPATMLRCGYPRDDGPTPDTYATRMVRRNGASAWFAALYRTDSDLEPVQLRLEEAPMERYAVVLSIGEQTHRHIIPQLAARR